MRYISLHRPDGGIRRLFLSKWLVLLPFFGEFLIPPPPPAHIHPHSPLPALKCVHVCAVVAMLLEYSEECWEEALAIWSLLPALHNKNRHTSTPVMDDKETGTWKEVGGGEAGWKRLSARDTDNKRGQSDENLKCGSSGHRERC